MDPERVKAKAAQKLEKRATKKSSSPPITITSTKTSTSSTTTTTTIQLQPTVNENGTIIYDFSGENPHGADTITTSSRRSWPDQADIDSTNQFAEDNYDFADTSVLSHPSFLEPSRAKRIKVQNIAIIYNPFSGSKIGEKIMNEARKYFEVHGLNVQIIPTEYKGHAEDLCKGIDVSGLDAVCLVGGDGTIHEAVNGIMKRDQESRDKFVLACLPAGTGNSFVMELQGTLSIKHICEKILNGLTVPFDVAKVTSIKKEQISKECRIRKEEFRTLKNELSSVDLNSSQLSQSLDAKRQELQNYKVVRPDILMEYGAHLADDETNDTPPEVFYSFNSLHWGLGSKVNITAEKMRWMGKAVRYTTAALIELFKGEKILARIEWEDANGEITALEDEFCLAIVNNIQGAAKGMKMAPKAKLNDGLFDLILIKSHKAFDLMAVFAKIYDGTHTELDYVIYKQVKRFSITPFKKDKERKKRLHKEKKRIRASKRSGSHDSTQTALEILRTECNTILSELEDQIEEEIIDIDGELKGATPFICEVLKCAVRVIV
eukprot:gene4313-5037_t